MTSITNSDGYKFSMAEAGAALRTETFYYSHRKGGINGWAKEVDTKLPVY